MDEEERSLGILFPLPFRVLVLIGLGVLGWATNLHGLAVLNVDAVSALELRNLHRKARPDPYVFYNPVYRIFLLYFVWFSLSWLLFRHLSNGNPFLVDVFGYIPGVAALIVALALICPFNILYKRDRDRFIQFVSSFHDLASTNVPAQSYPALSLSLHGWSCILLRRRPG